MSVEENKAIVRRHLIDVLEQGHVELIGSIYAPDGSTPDDWGTAENFKTAVIWHHKHCPGFKVNLLDLMAEEDRVMAYIQFDVTYSVEDTSPQMQPFGKPVSWRNVNIYRIANGKIVSERWISKFTDVMVEMGAYKLQKVA